MLERMPNSDIKHFSLTGVTADRMAGTLVPQMDIRNTHPPIPVRVLDGKVLQIDSNIRMDTSKIVKGALKSCSITATAYDRGIIGVNLDLYAEHEIGPVHVYFEFDHGKTRHKPLYLVRDQLRPYNHLHELLPFSQLGLRRQLAKLWPWAYPRVTV